MAMVVSAADESLCELVELESLARALAGSGPLDPHSHQLSSPQALAESAQPHHLYAHISFACLAAFLHASCDCRFSHVNTVQCSVYTTLTSHATSATLLPHSHGADRPP